ncbi:hypothetical protein AX14_007810 [Amanita brunnescens Koide BX004]|nr:hypothetical protein AX14_007810 [Amanita brunnescens Koide BX004]
MAAVTLSRPMISSPLAAAPESSRTTRSSPTAAQRRNSHFPASRALRPFASISQVLQQPKTISPQNQKPAVKLIEPPKNHKATFLLNLTQAELSRQD